MEPELLAEVNHFLIIIRVSRFGSTCFRSLVVRWHKEMVCEVASTAGHMSVPYHTCPYLTTHVHYMSSLWTTINSTHFIAMVRITWHIQGSLCVCARVWGCVREGVGVR